MESSGEELRLCSPKALGFSHFFHVNWGKVFFPKNPTIVYTLRETTS